jgi:hypothetical protein
MAISEKFKSKFNRLVEYKVHDHQSKPLYSNDIETGFIKEEDPEPDGVEADPTVDQQPISDLPTAETEPIQTEPPVADKVEQKTDILKDLAQNHTEKIDAILQYIEGINQEIGIMKQKDQEIDMLKSHVGELEKQVDMLTPPTPEESLEKMVRISGGQTIDQYWANYLAKQGKSVNGKMPYYANGVLGNEKAEIVNKKYSDDEIKKSLGL